MSVVEPLSPVTQEIKVSVTPSEGIVQGIVPTYTRFYVGFGLWPIALI